MPPWSDGSVAPSRWPCLTHIRPDELDELVNELGQDWPAAVGSLPAEVLSEDGDPAWVNDAREELSGNLATLSDWVGRARQPWQSRKRCPLWP